ncbi:hypothetical protein JCM10213_002957 [Rhodosporidiobolus nylandii]
MPPTRPSALSTSSSAMEAGTSSAPLSSSSRKRKGIPHKSPARTTPYPSTSSARASSNPQQSGTVLLRVLLSRPSSELEGNQRFKPPPALQQKKVKKVLGQRDKLEPVQEGFGRGHRTSRSALGAEYVDLSLFPGAAGVRGRSPGIKGKGREVAGPGRAQSAGGPVGRRAASASSGFSTNSHPYAGPSSYDHLAVPSTGSSGGYGRMARASSVNAAAAGAYAVPVPSPLARSFSANGAVTNEREARQRTPSGTGVQRVAELGGQLEYSPTAGYVAA